MGMIGTVAAVLRGEGLSSAVRRSGQRIALAAQEAAMLARGSVVRGCATGVLNVISTPLHARSGGVEAQLEARLRRERTMRSVAVLQPGILRCSRPVAHAHPAAIADASEWLSSALATTGARLLHLEGTAGAPLETILAMIRRGTQVALSIHDFSLFSSSAQEPEEPNAARRELATEIVTGARAVVFCSPFLREYHRRYLPECAATSVIEPGLEWTETPSPADRPRRTRIAFAGSVRSHKGADLLLPLLDELTRAEVELHVFGGGDERLLRSLRRDARVVVHGYYRAGTLPALLRRHRISLAVLPFPLMESFSLTLSECWRAGVPAVVFDRGAPAERIRLQGGGWVVPHDRGVAGIASVVREWIDGGLDVTTPASVHTADTAARGYVELYRQLGVPSGEDGRP